MYEKSMKCRLVALAVAVVFVLPVAGGAQDLETRGLSKPFAPTVVVSPVPGSPKASGKALLMALKAARLANERTKFQSSRIRLEPGVYDVGRTALRMVAGVDVEGSGVEETQIVGLGQSFGDPAFSFSKGVVVGADDTELRNLTVRCVNTSELDACITMSNHEASPRLEHVRLLATSPEGAHWGLRNHRSAPFLEDVEIVVANGTNNYGLVNALEGARPELRRTTLTAVGGSGENVGIFNKLDGLPMRLVDVEVTVMNGYRAVGVLTLRPGDFVVTGPKNGGQLTLRLVNVEIAALDAGRCAGFSEGGYTLEMRQSRVLSDGSAIDLGPTGNVDVAASELDSGEFFVHANDVRITGSVLLGGGQVVAYGEAVCAGNRTEGGRVDDCPGRRSAPPGRRRSPLRPGGKLEPQVRAGSIHTRITP